MALPPDWTEADHFNCQDEEARNRTTRCAKTHKFAQREPEERAAVATNN
jgi:hypothetical protein